jgi:hypothetical protein
MLRRDLILVSELRRPLELGRQHAGQAGEDIVQSNKALHQVQMAVLVDVPEFIEHCKRLPLGSTLPCTKGLQSFEVGTGSWRDSQKAPFDGPSPTTSIDDDRELNLAPRAVIGQRIRRRSTTLKASEFPDKIVKSGTDIVHYLANEDPHSIDGTARLTRPRTMYSKVFGSVSTSIRYASP